MWHLENPRLTGGLLGVGGFSFGLHLEGLEFVCFLPFDQKYWVQSIVGAKNFFRIDCEKVC